MLRRMALVRTDVSEELSASIIRVTRIGEPGIMLAVTSNRRTLRRNTKWERKLALNRRPHLPQPDNEPRSVAFLPFVGTVFNRISRELARHIKYVGLPHMKLSSLLCPVKDHLGLRTPGVYRIPCECGRVYTGQRGINGFGLPSHCPITECVHEVTTSILMATSCDLSGLRRETRATRKRTGDIPNTPTRCARSVVCGCTCSDGVYSWHYIRQKRCKLILYL
jgi:hypothetical protein